MALLDVNALVALVWDSHVHHLAMRRWFDTHHQAGWATCAVTESGFVRVSANHNALPHAVTVDDARRVLKAMRAVAGHRFLPNDVSLVDDDVPPIHSYHDVTDAQLLTVARRNGVRLVTFDTSLARLSGPAAVELLTVLDRPD